MTVLSSNSRLFADDTSLFSVVQDMTSSAYILNNDLLKINNCAYQWKMSFNAEPSKQAQEVINTHPPSDITSSPAHTSYSLNGHSSSLIIGRLQQVHSIIRIFVKMIYPPRTRTRTFAVETWYADHCATRGNISGCPTGTQI